MSVGANAVNYNADPTAPACRCQLRNCSQPVAPAWSVQYWRGYATFALPPPPPPAPPPPGVLDRVLLTEAASRDGAVCLDGTPAAYYWRSGSGSGKNSWVLFLEGGGWCAGLGTAVGGFDSCLSRSHGGLGSSKSYGPTMTLGEGAATWSADPETSALSLLGVCCDAYTIPSVCAFLTSHLLQIQGFGIGMSRMRSEWASNLCDESMPNTKR